MGLLVFVAKILLTILNTVFAMLALIMVGIGCLIFYSGDILMPWINLVLEQLVARGVITTASLDVSGFDIVALAQQAAWPTVMCGAVLFCISFVGCCGANCESKVLLIVYSIIIGVLLFIEILAIIVLAGGQNMFKQQITDKANLYVKDQYRGDNSSDAFSVVLNVAQMGLKCCGIDDYLKLQDATHWNRGPAKFSDQKGNEITGTLLIPFSCCKMKEPFPSVTPENINCVTTLAETTSYYKTPCIPKIWWYATTYSWWAIVGTLGFLGAQVAILVLSILIIHQMGKINPIV